jgi:hypothetical protein
MTRCQGLIMKCCVLEDPWWCRHQKDERNGREENEKKNEEAGRRSVWRKRKNHEFRQRVCVHLYSTVAQTPSGACEHIRIASTPARVPECFKLQRTKVRSKNNQFKEDTRTHCPTPCSGRRVHHRHNKICAFIHSWNGIGGPLRIA